MKYNAFFFNTFTVSILLSTCAINNFKYNNAMDLILKINNFDLEEVFKNNTSDTIRLWESQNSWGWHSNFFQLKSEGSTKIYIIKRKDREWTKNGPSYFEILPQDIHSTKIDLNDTWWQPSEDIKELKNKIIYIKSVFKISETPESLEHGIYIEKFESSWVKSLPPHKWLFPNN